MVWIFRARAKGADWLDIEALVKKARFRRFEVNKVFGGFVVDVDDSQKTATVDLGGKTQVTITLRKGMAWARKFNTFSYTRKPKRPSQVLKIGDAVLVKPTKISKKSKSSNSKIYGLLEQTPIAQAALVAINPQTREVKALVGGYGVGAGKFNRATQANRQAGSTFKPLLYLSAFETGEYNTISPCQDAPIVYLDQWTGRSWKPKNYDGKFDGIITFRRAHSLSKTLLGRLIDKVGVDKGSTQQEEQAS